ncbi:hypothetical protein AXF14_09930 [Actinomyces radicidentis]|uniref:Lysine transporter LysE n=1 Tax=Actinomyces radicidentis TaxID=111015 RepID=A0A0X8JFF1_ACTRD|nr:LysE family translocator [Actinomyces radicidentis]AMD87840.1 hypothetical protein AXF14_09930 [Actinomyces radicidentis]
MTLLHALVGFALVVGVLTLVPGIDTALVLRSALTRSRGNALATVLGVSTGIVVWGAAAGVGATAVLAASRTAYRLLTLAGALYLMGMGATMLWRSWPGRAQAAEPERAGGTSHDAVVEAGALAAEGAPADSAWRGWWTGALTNLLNPKVCVFFLATIPQFMVTGVPPLAMGVLLALVHAALCTAWLGLIALGAGWAGPRPGSSAVVRWTDRVTGGVLLAFGGRLALQARA